MANQFTNTGFATILPRQTQGVYNTLLWGKRQAQENKEFQVKQRAAVDDFNYKVFKDYSNLDFKGMDGNHKAVLKDMASGYMSTALEAYKQARQQGVKLDPTALEKIKSDTYAARDIMLSHQQGMQELNQLYKQNPDLYSEDMLKDAFSQMYKTDEEGKIDVNSPNLDYSAQDLKKLASDPKYVNYGYGVNKFVENMGKTISSKFSTFKDPNSGEFFDREEDFESYKRLVEMGENGRPKISEKTGLPIFKDSQAVLAEMAISPDPEIQASYKALLHNAEQQGISAVDLLDKELAPMRTSDLKKQDNTRIARTTGSNGGTSSKRGAFESADVEYKPNNDMALRSGVGLVKGKKWAMPDLVRGMNIQIDGEALEADFQGIVPTENGYQFEFSRKTSPSTEELAQDPANSEKRLRTVRVPLTDASTEKAIINALSGNEKKAFEKTLSEAKSAKIETSPISKQTTDKFASTVTSLLKSGDYEILTKELNKIGLEEGEDFEVKQKSWWEPSSSRGINIDGVFYSASDKDKLAKAISNKINPELDW